MLININGREFVAEDIVENACEDCILAIKNQLPEDKQTFEVFKFILQESIDILETKTINL